MQTANQGMESRRTKTILCLLNFLILSSLFLLPSLLFLSALNVEEIAMTAKLDNPTQTIQGGKIVIASAISARNVGPFSVDATLKATVTGSGGTKIDIPISQISLPAGTTLNKQQSKYPWT
jgi:hypothetical protein